MARLLGLNSAVHVSRIEQGWRDPDFATAFAYASIFGVSLCELFPHNAKETKEGIWERAQSMCEEARCSGEPHALRRAHVLDSVPNAAYHPHRRHYDV